MIAFRPKSKWTERWISIPEDGEPRIEKSHFLNYDFKVDGVVYTEPTPELDYILAKANVWRLLSATAS